MTNVDYAELSKKLEEFEKLDSEISALVNFKSCLLEFTKTHTEVPIYCSIPGNELQLRLDPSQAKLFYDLLNTYQAFNEQKLKEL